MRTPYRAILRAHITRWQSWLVLVFWLLQVFAFIPAALSQRGVHDLFPMILFAVGYTCAAIAVQTKEHLGAYRAALVPGFRRPHLVMAVLALGVAVLPFPVAAAVAGGSALGIAGLAVPMGALAFAGCCRGGWRAVTFFLGYLVVFVPGVRQGVAGLTAGQYPWAAAALCVCGLWLLADAVFFLATMDEETPGYEMQFRSNLRQFRGHQARQNMSAAIRHLDRQNSIWLRLVDVQIPDAMPYLGASRWRRILHWRRAQANQWFAVLMPSLIWLVMVALQLGLAQGAAAPGRAALRSTMWVLVMMPPMLALSAWQARGGMLNRELTYPLRRRDFLIEQAVAVLVPQYAAWLLVLLAMATVAAVLRDTALWADLGTAAVVAGPWQAVVFALLARLGTLGSGLPLVIGMLLAAFVGTLVLMGCVVLGSPTVTATVSAALVLLAVAALALAYRHWLRVDIA